jgi:serine protease inhibitor
MTPSRLRIDLVKHKTFVEVNEEGTEAAAVTGVGMTRGIPDEMIVNRPFFLVIRDNQTGTILFMGSIVEPEEK